MEELYLLHFQKIAGARFLSHLDMARLFVRAYRRAKLPLKFSEGFHAHPKVRFSPPLSVGVESLCETCLFTLVDETRECAELLELLRAGMPDGFVLTALEKIGRKPEPPVRARYAITFPAGSRAALSAAFSAPMPITKRTKSGEREIDLFPHLTLESLEDAGSGTVLRVLSPASEALTVNPNLILGALTKKDPTLKASRILKTAALRN